MIIALALGIALGFFSAIPVAGPVSAVIFSRGMEGKFSQGLAIAIGSGLMESAYCFLAFWGFTHFLSNLTSIFAISNAVGAILLGFLGVYFFRSKKMRESAKKPAPAAGHEKKAFFVGMGISAVNPSLIATWTLVCTSVYSMRLFKFTTTHCLVFSGGVWVGIVGWFAILLALLVKHRSGISPKVLDRGLKIMGVGLGGLSVWMLVRFIQEVTK